MMREQHIDRHELKYMINYFDYVIFKNKFDKILKRDQSCQEAAYTITSLYFDDIQNSALKQKVDGDAFRYKYRIRYYNHDTSCFKLEKKSKYEQMTSKTSLDLSKEDVDHILEGQIEFLKDTESEVGTAFYNEIIKNRLLPKVIVEYERLAFIHPIGDLRITFDTAIKASFHQFDFTNQKYILTPLLEPNDVVLEIKFNHELPQFIKGILESNHSIQESISKYALSRQYNYYL